VPRPSEDITDAIRGVERELEKANDWEAPHNRRERRWSNGGVVGLWAAAIVGVFAIGFGYYGAYKQEKVMIHQQEVMSNQLNAMRDQLTLTYPPKLSLADLHIWTQGKGELHGSDNPLPELTPGSVIEGSANIVNTGREPATIFGSDIVARWRGPLNMNNPAWGDPGHNRLRRFDHYDGQLGDLAGTLNPGEDGRWAFQIKLPDDLGAPANALYVFGHVAFRDRLGTTLGLYFVREYDSKKGVFVKPPDEPIEEYEFPN